MRIKVNRKLCCVTDFVDHVIRESTAIYAGTEHADSFFIFHDALSQWWEKEAQEYVVQRGFGERQLKCMGNTNINNRYRGKLTGDSPEMCRALDSHGFADLTNSIKFHCGLSSLYPVGDPRRFHMGTPKQVYDTMKRCWEVEPTSERIVEDIMNLPSVLQKIITARGCVVPDLVLRTGRRGAEYVSLRAGMRCKHKPVNRQRKATMKGSVIHPDCIEAHQMLCNGALPVVINDELDAELMDVEQVDGDDSDDE